jgi:hypothetical protein
LDSEGLFQFNNLPVGTYFLQIRDDEDGDGWPERMHTLSTRLDLEAHPDGLNSVRDPDVTSVSLGRIALTGVFSLEGHAFVDDGAGNPTVVDQDQYVIRLAVNRSACGVGQSGVVTDVAVGCDGNLDTEIGLSNEVSTAADGTGRYVFSGLGAGTIFVHPLLYERSVDPLEPGQLVAAHPPFPVQGKAGESLSVGDILFEPVPAQPTQASRRVRLSLFPTPTEDTFVLLTPPGMPVPECGQINPTQPSPVAGGVLIESDAPSENLDRDIPLGEWDVLVCAGTLSGRLFSQLLPAHTESPPPVPLWGPILMTEVPECLWRDDPENPVGTQRDCDGDGVPGLPPQGEFDAPADQLRWENCRSQCEAAFGALSQALTCTVGDDVFDCDDDGDGQPDVTEDPRCYGPGRGTDLDGDGLCSGTDPFPQCAANLAELCPAGEDDLYASDPNPTDIPRCRYVEATAFGARDYCLLAGLASTGGDCPQIRVKCQLDAAGAATAQCACEGPQGSSSFTVGTGGQAQCDADRVTEMQIWGRCLARQMCTADQVSPAYRSISITGDGGGGAVVNAERLLENGDIAVETALPTELCVDAQRVTLTNIDGAVADTLGVGDRLAFLGDVIVESNGAGAAATFNPAENMAIGGSLEIRDNTGLDAINGLSLDVVGGAVTLQNNPNLSVINFPALRFVGGDFTIQGSPNLDVSDIDAFETSFRATMGDYAGQFLR